MKLERFYEKFELFADAPNAVGKMRELVLQLAVRGRLVEQFDEVEPASEMLHRLPGRSPSLIGLGNLPLNWVCVALGDLIALKKGKKPTSLSVEKIGLPYLDIAALERRELRQFTEDSMCPRATTGDLIIVCDGSRSGLVLDGIDGVLGSTVSKIEYSGFDRNYLKFFLRSLYDDLNGAKKGAAIPHLNIPRLLAIPAPIPPLSEQKRIVAKVDELMALCDQLEAQQQERDTRHAALARASLARFAEAPAPANLDFLFHKSYAITPADLRKSILTLAVQGKLVPQDPNDEPAEMLFVKLERERRRFADAHKFRAPVGEPVDASSVPFAIPATWKWCRLSSLFNAVTDGDHLPPPKSDAGIAFLTIGNITTGTLDFEGSRFVPNSYYQGLADFRRPLCGDILYTVVGATYGRPALVETDRPFCVQRHIAILKPTQSVDVGFLMAVLRSPLAYDQATASTTGTAQPTIPLGSLRNFAAPLPPLAEQRRIVAKVDQLMALVDQLESQLTEAKSRSAALLEAIVHELLNPTAEIIDLASYRASVGCYTISKMCKQPYFGRTTAVKSFYFGEAHVGMKLGFQHERKAAGPLDPWIYRFEEEGKQREWFKAVENTSNGKTKVDYQPGKLLAAQAAQAETLLTLEQRKEFDRLLDLLSDKKTEEVEIIATLFAAWNDFLIDGHAPSDDEIVTEVRENWHVKKERFTPTQLRQWLGWLRQNNLVPQGRLPHTVHQSKLSLN